MKPKRRRILGIMLPGFGVGILGLLFLGKTMGTLWLRSHSTVYLLERPAGFQLSIAVHRYPRLAHFPEYLGFGEGFVQLFDRETGKVFEDVTVEDLGSVNTFAWGSLTVA